MTRWVDDHTHLTDPRLGERAWRQARRRGVERMVCVGTDVDDSRAAIRLATELDGVVATAGVHPHEARHGIAGLSELVDHPGVRAVGECGLDFHYDHSPRAVQAEVFAAQVELALRHDLALVIHTREAWEETFEVLDREGAPERMVFHCFTGGPAEAAECLARGGVLSISGIVTFSSADGVREAVAATPREHLLLETDAPYLAPVPHRGKLNEPAYVVEVGHRVAELVGCSVDELAETTWATAEQIYGPWPSRP